MPNEFIARNGVIALNNSTVTGSLNVTAGITGSLLGTASFATTASFALNAGGAAAASNLIFSGSVTASVDINGDTFRIISGSSTFLFVSSSGNVGINTTSSTAQLEVRKSAQTKPNIILSGPNNFNGGDFRGLAVTNYYSDVTLNNKQLAIYNADSINYPYFRVSIANLNYVSVDAVTGSTAGSKDLYLGQVIYITSGSNVGIGTLVPAAKFQVSGTINVANIRGSGSLATSSIFTVDGAAGRLFSVNDSLSGSLFSVNTIAGLPVIEAFSDNTVRIGQYGQKALFVSQSRIGVGTETPTALLHITGATGNLFEVDGSGSVAALSVSASGRIGVGVDSSRGRFDVAYAGLLNDPTILVGADDSGSSARTSLINKVARMGMLPYNLNATASAILIASSTATANNVFIGGGSSYLNASTNIFFYTGPTTASLIGTEKMSIDSTGSVNILSGSLTVSSSITTSGSITGNIVTKQLIYNVITVNPSTNQNDYSPTGWNDVDPNKATTIDVSGSSSIKITGLAGGTNGRIAIIRNSSPDRLLILEDQSTLSSAANRFDFRNAVFLVPNGSIHLMYDGASSRWEPLGSSANIGFNGFFDQYDDFLGGVSATGSIGIWGSAVSGSTTSTVQSSTYLQNTTERPLGIIEASTGTSATGRAHIGSPSSASIQPGYGQAIMLTRVATEQRVTPASQNSQIYVGWHDAVNSTRVTDGVYWAYNSASSGVNWTAVVSSASVSSSVTTSGFPVDLNYTWLGIYINPQWSRATYFYSTDSSTWNIATEISASTSISSSQTGFGVTINKTVGTTAHLVAVDLLAHRYDTSRG